MYDMSQILKKNTDPR